MSYNAGIPVATTSPSLFPALAQANWTRLEAIVGADHQFNATIAANDGYHNLVHMQIPGTLPSGALASLGRLFVNTANGQVNLFYMDDAGTSYQITPTYVLSTQRFVGTQNIVAGGTASIFNPSYDYTGFVCVYVNGTNVQRTYTLTRSGGTAVRKEISDNTGAVSRPTVAYTGTDLIVTNNDGSAQDIVWSLFINRI